MISNKRVNAAPQSGDRLVRCMTIYTPGRNLGQLHIVINPNFFSSSELFRQHLSQTMRELKYHYPPRRFNQVYLSRTGSGY